MKGVSKVFVGAYTVMANGNLVSRNGTALVALMAQTYHVPFIVCCETYKFTERVQLESISFNELGTACLFISMLIHAAGDPDELVLKEGEKGAALKGWKELPALKLLNLVYDLTPNQFIVMVITEVGMVPPTSVPAILREYKLGL
jgi:translation initiation factor eIF-2B subunit delta